MYLYYVWVIWALKVLKEKYIGEVSQKNLFLGLLLALPVAILMYFFKDETSLQVMLLTSATFSVFGGLVEETIYRGLLLDALTNRSSLREAVIIQSIILGLSHLWSWETIIATSLLGILLAIVRLKIGIGFNATFH